MDTCHLPALVRASRDVAETTKREERSTKMILRAVQERLLSEGKATSHRQAIRALRVPHLKRS